MKICVKKLHDLSSVKTILRLKKSTLHFEYFTLITYLPESKVFQEELQKQQIEFVQPQGLVPDGPCVYNEISPTIFVCPVE